MNATHSSGILSTAILIPVLKWLLTWPIHSPDDAAIAGMAGLLIASPPAIKALVNWFLPPKAV